MNSMLFHSVNVLVWIITLAIAVLLSGCTFSKQTAAPRQASTGQEKVQLKLEVTNTSYYEGRMDSYALAKQRFENKHPHVEVIFVRSDSTPSREEDKFDLVEVGTDMLLAQAPRLIDLTPLLHREKVDLEDFYDAILEQKVVDGRVMALPSYPEPLAVFYSKRWFDAAGMAYPAGGWT